MKDLGWENYWLEKINGWKKLLVGQIYWVEKIVSRKKLIVRTKCYWKKLIVRTKLKMLLEKIVGWNFLFCWKEILNKKNGNSFLKYFT